MIGLLIKNSTDEYLTKNTQTNAGKEVQTIAHQLCHTDKESFVGMLEEWYERWGEWLKHRTLDKNTGKDIYPSQSEECLFLNEETYEMALDVV